ncbi:putative acetyl CoA carboxylase beta subunit [Bifidobacterium adolescentis ATCC 15703]|uniref:Acetyl CoA carboxylase beta subunit n=1 Tax=Bifidobacterium adolescentis (strain ATCC 15703 / DSM 20083 / NCTC 11814 / E194a) TaxID=367928 RepID=A1A3J2_BIFAA|nr:putative acetyl CoA carboxylase beta subunit [Bifidobacterium adolescentis ATCC 15703]
MQNNVMTKARGGGAAADVPLPWRGCDASRDGRGERSEPDEHARSRRARRRAVRGGSRTGFHHLRSGQLRHQSHVWICKRPPSIMVMLAVHVPLNILSHRIWLIYGRFGRLGFTAGSLGQNVHPALAAIS